MYGQTGWLNDTTREIARSILEDKRWSLFPILADALEDGSYPYLEVLWALRNKPTHPHNLLVVNYILVGDTSHPYRVIEQMDVGTGYDPNLSSDPRMWD